MNTFHIACAALVVAGLTGCKGDGFIDSAKSTSESIGGSIEEAAPELKGDAEATSESASGEMKAMADTDVMFINAECPIMGADVGEGDEFVEFESYKIGICCSGCNSAWEELSLDEKQAFVQKSLAGGS